MATRNPSLNNLASDSFSRSASPGILSSVTDSNDAELHGPRGAWWWTGKHPKDTPGYGEGALRALPLPSLQNFTRQGVLDYFDNTWTMTEVLFASLQGSDAFVRQPYHQLRHPKIFYYGHPAVLYVNKFRVAGLLEDGIDPFIEQMFETGVDEMSWDDLSQGRNDWPPVRALHEYRQKAYLVIRSVIESHPGLAEEAPRPVGWGDACWAVFMGFEHERIHIETSSVLIRELPLTSVRKPEFWPEYHPSSKEPSPAIPTEGIDYPSNDKRLDVVGENVELGKPLEYPSFGWDNEYGRKMVPVGDFSASRFKVTNGEFLRFVRARGYSNPKYWSTEGWGWKTFRNVKWPTFWIPDGPQGLHRYRLRLLFDAVDMRWDWPVDVNYHEAKAYCAWRTEQDGSEVMYRVISEAEHMLLRSSRDRVDFFGAGPDAEGNGAKRSALLDESLNVDVCMQACGADAASRFGFNFQLAHGSQSPVTELPPSEKGFYDVLGNAWEWAEDHYAAFPGFKVHPYYEDFSSPCFGGKHNLILGGSFISTGQLASKFARYQFRPHFFQHATFRVVCQAVEKEQYDMTRYGRESPLVPFFHTSCMDCPKPHVGDGPCCSVGHRSAFTPTIVEGNEQSQAKQDATQVMYESDAAVSQFLSLHYGPIDKVYPEALLQEGGLIQASLEAPRRSAELLAAWARRSGLPLARALDLGCSVGRGSFELTSPACGFAEVIGVDISTRFIEIANKIRESRRMDYDLHVEGEITERATAALEDGIDCSRVRFVHGDACSLPSGLGLGSFDAVLVTHVIDRVPDPVRLIKQVAEALRTGGVALLSSPFSWSDKYTNRANWVGGTHKDGQPQRSVDILQDLVSDLFDVLSNDTMPMLIPCHSRKFELLFAHCLVLRKK